MQQDKIDYLKYIISDKISDIFYYDRKECDTVSVKDMESITNKQVQELIKQFETEMIRNISTSVEFSDKD